MSKHQLLMERTAKLVATASEGVVSEAKALQSGVTLTEQGLTSLAYLRLIDSVETEFGVYIDLEEDTGFLQSVEGLVNYMVEQGVSAPSEA
ncbi:acyl carrier protein [Streptomyces sp. NPDC018833]|uniref:acyl carrier protein n=1 Tax=Streptomyces sp. NPDC018833 TaxID=3365053 RepID=UPI0037A3E80C